MKKFFPNNPYFILTFVFGLLFVRTFLNFEPIFTEGDQGRDLYCIKHVFDGQKPYLDFWWEYGPLMLYYYALCFKLLGVSIQSVILGKQVIVFLSGIFVYLGAAAVIPPVLAFSAAVFFWIFRPDFFYTFNHIGGMFCTILLLYALLQYFNRPKQKFLILGMISVIVLNLIRLNIGFSSLLAFLLSIYIFDKFNGKNKPWIFYAWVSAGTGIVTALIYIPFIIGVPQENLLKCFPYLPSYHAGSWTWVQGATSFIKIVWFNFNATILRKIFGLLLAALSVRIIYLWRKDQIKKSSAGPILLSLIIFSVFNVHEYLASKYIFRLFWAFPSVVLLFFAIIHFGSNQFPDKIRKILLFSIAILMVYLGISTADTISYYKKPVNLFVYGSSRIYMANAQWGEHKGLAVDHWAVPKWTHTVTAVTDYLKAQLNPGEPFLAIPYDSLYYFLSGHDSAVYPLAFFKYMNISPPEQIEMMHQLEQKHVRFIIISNRAYSHDPDLGVFGVDYCVLLKKYIFDHYKPVAAFGDFQGISNFQENHGVMILKKI